ncbi:RES family NAD+ phosphorylase [Microbacterium panaciterrae]|uniref:RES family NAD+ phosphorylase n=1 Tax=Microbacterium panaciterrae TaxID=985759 RepID=UPI0031E55415
MHDPQRAGNVFNPGAGSQTRFASFASLDDLDGPQVPTLYAAATAEAAVCESILHDVPVAGGLLPEGSYATRVETALDLRRDLNLAMLMGPGLRRLGATPQQLTATDADVYDQTVLWAQAAHDRGFDGIAWMSARDNTSEAYVLFGDRVDKSDLHITERGVGSFAPGTPGFSWLSAYCSRVKIELLIA